MQSLNYNRATRSGVHVQVSFNFITFRLAFWTFHPELQMETFTHAEDNQNDIFPKVKEGSDTDVELDVERKGSL